MNDIKIDKNLKPSRSGKSRTGGNIHFISGTIPPWEWAQPSVSPHDIVMGIGSEPEYGAGRTGGIRQGGPRAIPRQECLALKPDGVWIGGVKVEDDGRLLPAMRGWLLTNAANSGFNPATIEGFSAVTGNGQPPGGIVFSDPYRGIEISFAWAKPPKVNRRTASATRVHAELRRFFLEKP